jgi:signal transduction histidine kinase/ActR/RegA family two-component response regulator
MANGPGSVEVCLRCKDGSIRNCIVYGRFVGTPGQKVLSAVYLDITERRKSELEREKLQNQLSQSQRLESVGQLAGGIAHDYNNMLGVILGHVELSIVKAGSQSIVAKNLVEIQKAAKRSAELTQQLLAFARKQTISPVVFDLNDAVQDTVEMLGWLIGEHIKLSWLPGSGPLPVKMDPNQLDQILVNLCVNGRDAISGTGRIVIETTSVLQNENQSQEDPSIHPGSYVLLSVTDTGCGMDKETQEKIFEPFYTTKGLGHGTGLGLATVYGVVKQNGGVIIVDSSPGRGSCFQIYLPKLAVKEKIARTCATDGMQTVTGAGETILVVEDEVGVLEIYTAMLEDLGYNVLAASLPSEAFVLAHEYGDQIDLLLTDIILPEMNGWQVEIRIREMIPDIACLFVSGYSADVISSHGVLAEGVHFMEKPFTMQQLAEKVGDALCREAIPAF